MRRFHPSLQRIVKVQLYFSRNDMGVSPYYYMYVYNFDLNFTLIFFENFQPIGTSFIYCEFAAKKTLANKNKVNIV